MKAIKDLNEGRLDILIASDIFKEGVDIPTVPTLINAAGQKSKVATIQRIGRALRPKPPHNKALIIDFIDGNEPLKRHSLQRFKALSALFPTFVAETLSDIVQQMSPTTLNF
jgi:superfamily II DNA or RNA helicase